jgi:hypothetical protein
MGSEWRELSDGRQRLREDGIIEMRHSRTTQTLESIRQQMEHVAELLGGTGKAPMLVVMGEARGQTREAREFLRKDPSIARHMTRVALLHRSPVSRVLAAFFTRLVKPQVPVRVFADEEQAVAWLLEGRSSDK